MKNSNSHKNTKSPIRQITKFAVLLVIVFLAISCNLNARGNGNTEEAVKILTGPCGETKENSNDVVEINGQKYYTTKSNYEKDYYPFRENDELIKNKPFTEETKNLFHKVRTIYWTKWLNGDFSNDVGMKCNISNGNLVFKHNGAKSQVEINENNTSFFVTSPFKTGIVYVKENEFMGANNDVYQRVVN